MFLTFVDEGVEEAELKDGEEDKDHAHLNISDSHQLIITIRR